MDPLLSDWSSQMLLHIIPDMAVAILTTGALLLGLSLLVSWALRLVRERD